MGKRDPVDKAIRDAARAGVREAMAGEGPEGFPHVEGELEEVHPLERLFINLPAGEGYYLKVYKKSPLPPDYKGQLQFLTHLDDPTAIEDLDIELNRLAQSHNWGAGVFQVRLFQRGRSGYVRAPVDIALQPPLPAASPAGNSDRAGLLKEVELLKAIKDITGGGASDPTKLADSLVQTLKTGVEIAGTTQGTERLEGLAKTAESVIGLLSKAGLIGQKTPNPAEQVYAKLLERMLERELAPHDKEDPLEELTRLRQMAEVFGLGGGGGEKPSVAIELVRQVAPQLGDMVARITDTIKQGLEVARLRISLAHGLMPQRPAALPAAFLPELREAMRRQDPAEFPRVAASITTRVPDGPGLLEGLRVGAVTAEQAVGYLESLGLPTAEREANVRWAGAFIEWLREQRPPAPAPPAPAAPVPPEEPLPGQVVAHCQLCSAEYRYDSWRDFEQDDHVCDAPGHPGLEGRCGGEIRSREAGGEAGTP